MTKSIKKSNITDPGGSVIGALVGLAGTFGILTKWSISADQAAQVLGFAFMIAAALRTWLATRINICNNPEDPIDVERE